MFFNDGMFYVLTDTHSEEGQQQLDAFTIQPAEKKSHSLLSARVEEGGLHGRKEVDLQL